MCYTGVCKYERFDGECSLNEKKLLAGPPNDAWCANNDDELDEEVRWDQEAADELFGGERWGSGGGRCGWKIDEEEGW